MTDSRRLWPALVLGGILAVGLALRIASLGQSAFGDEVATYWIVATNGIGGVIETVHTDAEITPPLSFVLSEIATQIDLNTEMLRLPSLIAGILTIGIVYLIGQRLSGTAAGLVAAAITALAPFMIYYSAEARAYSLMMFFVAAGTLMLLLAATEGRRRWWALWALASLAAMYTHYTALFALIGQFVWVVAAYPAARRSALIAAVGAAACFLPWITGAIADFNSPTTDILSGLEPFTLENVRISLIHWSIAFPYSLVRARALPGLPAMIMLAIGLALALVALAVQMRRSGTRPPLQPILRQVGLPAAMLLSVLLLEASFSAVSTNLFGVRNLAAAWPALALCMALLVTASRGILRPVAVTLVIACFAIGAVKQLEPDIHRPDYESAAHFIDRQAEPGDVVVDGLPLTPGPLSSLDVYIPEGYRVYRLGAPQQDDHPFSIADRVLTVPEVARRVVKAVRGRRLIIVTTPGPGGLSPSGAEIVAALPAGYRKIAAETYDGLFPLTAVAYAGKDVSLPRQG